MSAGDHKKRAKFSKKLVVTCSSCMLIRYFDDPVEARVLAEKHERLYSAIPSVRTPHIASVGPNLPEKWGQL